MDHFRAIRASNEGREALLVVYIENNMSHVWAERISTKLKKRFNPILVVSHDSTDKNRPGVTTTQKSKESGVIRLQQALEEDGIRFAKTMISKEPAKHRQLVCQQAKAYRQHVKQPSDLNYGVVRSSMNGKGPGLQDDVITCLHQDMELSAVMRKDPAFVAFCAAGGRAV